VACPWRKSDVALAQLAGVRAVRGGADHAVARHALGVVQTTWCGFPQFDRAYRGIPTESTPGKSSAAQAARCFVTLFKAIRENSSEERLEK